MDQYLTIATVAKDPAMNRRVAACAAQQGIAEGPEMWAAERCYTWAASPGWGATWDSAVASGVPDPGADPAVITDQMILSQVQSMLGTSEE